MILKENKMGNFVNILNINFEIIDTLEYITLADSFVKNKIGTGHGEAKLYVGNENDRTYNFFENMSNLNCFFLKKDFEFLTFQLSRVGVNPPRVYMNSNSEYYEFMRDIALPNISYLSILKLKNLSDGSIWYYFKIFIDYRPDIVGYKTLEESRQEDIINHSFGISVKEKEKLIKARIGQGEYRNKLLEECPYCPFTMVNDERLLIASHIKPWVKSNDKEKIDPKNGFMFTPTYDKLFDRGFITFENDKTLKVSPWLSPMNQKRLGIYNGMLIEKLSLDDKREKYLKYHRENIFKD